MALASGRKLIYGVECKRHLAPIVDQAVRQARRAAESVNGQPLIMAAYISQPLGERLRKEGVDYIDAEGNVSLIHSPLCILLGGNMPSALERSSGGSKDSRSAMQLMALLLTDPTCLHWPLRSLAQAAGISLGSAHGLMRDLQRIGPIRVRGSVSPEIAQGGDLLERWGYGYVQRLRPKLFIKTYRTTEGRQVADLIPLVKQVPGVLVGGELAADITTGLFRASRVTLHVSPDISLDALAQTMRLLPDIQGNVDVLTHFGHGPVWEKQAPNGVALIADPLVYGELLIPIDDRLREARGYYQARITEYENHPD
ncbi:MAG: type IV toxin-antitoxin system AbiEi family antitoxin [Phycisphaerae bacterium]